MNKREIYKELVGILGDLEGAKRLTVSAASSYDRLTTLADQVGEEATSEEARDLSDGSNLLIDAPTLREIAESPDPAITPALLRRAAKSLEDATARASCSQAEAEDARQRPHRDLEAARDEIADLQAQLNEANAAAAIARADPLRLTRKKYPDAHITVDFPAIVEPEPEPAESG